MESIVGNFEIPERVTDEPLEELELAPPFVMMLCIEWIVAKMCGCCYAPGDKVLSLEPIGASGKHGGERADL